MSAVSSAAPRRVARRLDGVFSPGGVRLGVILLMVLVWEIGVRFFGDPLFLAPPSQVLRALIGLVGEGQVMQALATTLYELVVAFLMSVAIGLPLGLLVGINRFMHGSFYPIVLLLYSIPKVTILPLFILGFGIGPASKIAFGVIHGIFPIIVAVVAGVQSVKPTLLTCARSMGASRGQILLWVILPQMVPSFFTGMRIAMTGTLLGVLLAELYVSQAGVGHFTRLFTESFEPAKLFALIAMLAAIAVALNELCRRGERRMSRWHQ